MGIPGSRTLRIRPVERASVLFWYLLFGLAFGAVGMVIWKQDSRVFGGIFLAIGLLLLSGVVHSLLGRSRFGESQLRLEIPVSPGQEAQGTIFVPKRIADARHMQIEIRCVQVQWGGSGESRSLKHNPLWSNTNRFPLTRRGLGSECAFSFELPRDLPNSTIGHEAVAHGTGIYWEIDAHADVPGIDYMRKFRIPVHGV